MRARWGGALAALVLAAVGMGAGFSGGGGGGGGPAAVDLLIPGREYSLHPFTDADYLARTYVTAGAAIAPCFDDGDSSFMFYKALTDSIRQSLGRFNPAASGSSWGGADVRGTAFVEVTNVGTGAYLTPAHLRSFNQLHHEAGSHGKGSESMGAYGFDASRNLVTFGSITGMRRSMISALLSSYQDSTQAWGIRPFRSHGYTRWKQQLGMADLWRANGYFQAKSLAQPVAYDQGSSGGVELSAQQRNDDPLVPSIFGRQGTNGYNQGFHRIGEPMEPYDIGSRGSWDSDVAASGTVEGVKQWTDMIVQMQQLGVLTFHNIEATPAIDLDISEADMSTLVYYWARLESEGLLDVLTFEQMAARIRGIRDGNQIPHHNFTMLDDIPGSSLLADSITVPIGLIPSLGSITFYGLEQDTMDANTAGRWKAAPGDTLFNAYSTLFGNADSLSYGLADSTVNVLLQQGTTTNTDAVPLLVVASGAEARYMRYSVQVIPLNDPGATEWASDFFLAFKAGQFEEVWEDNVNAGRDAYANMKALIGGRNVGDPDWTGFDAKRVRCLPQFNPILGDTTQAGATYNPSTYASLQGWHTLLRAPSLRPFIQNHKTNDWDFVSMYGNYTTLFAIGSSGDIIVPDNVDALDEKGKISTFHFYVPVNELTDFIYSNMMIERESTTMSSAGEVAILNVSVDPVR